MSNIDTQIFKKASLLTAVFLFMSAALVGSCKTASQSAALNKIDPASGTSMVSSLPTNSSKLKRYAREVRGLIETSPEYIGKMLGQDIVLAMRDPDLERRDFPAIIWQYRSDACVLDVYFMANEGEQKTAQPYLMPVKHFEFRKRGGEAVNQSNKRDMANCLRQLMGSEFADTRSDKHVTYLYSQAG